AEDGIRDFHVTEVQTCALPILTASPPAPQEPLTPGRGTRLDPWYASYAERTHGMKASEIRALFSVPTRPEVVSLAGGMPSLAGLPMEIVAQVTDRLPHARGAAAPQSRLRPGSPALREQITTVMAEEGITSHRDDVVVTTGSQQALDLVTRIFVVPGDVVVAEAPSYVGALGVFLAYQADVVHVEMGDDGLVPE